MIAVANDHVGYELKDAVKALLNERGLEYRDYGAFSADKADYPVFAQKAADAIVRGECERGILICGTGVGISIAANKVPGIRCIVGSDCYSAKLSRQHNDTNMIALGARVVGPELARMILECWLDSEFEGGRHRQRVDMIARIEQGDTLY